MPEPWATLLTFIVFVLLLYLMQRWITQHVQGIAMLLFDSYDAGMAALWLLLLPGIIVHELSHWVMARVLRLGTGRFRVWPQLKGRDIILGAVEVQKTNPLADSLVGLAPFLGGTLLLLIIGYLAFDVGALGLAWELRAWNQMTDWLSNSWQVADAWLWLYLIVAVSNAMMPSTTDRASWHLVLIYLALVSGVLLIFGRWPALPNSLILRITDGLRTLTYAFGLALLVDLVFALVVLVVELAVSMVRGSKVVYK